jgi:hypothetical protein
MLDKCSKASHERLAIPSPFIPEANKVRLVPNWKNKGRATHGLTIVAI